jgi:hypothetical protein
VKHAKYLCGGALAFERYSFFVAVKSWRENPTPSSFTQDACCPRAGDDGAGDPAFELIAERLIPALVFRAPHDIVSAYFSQTV